MRWGFEVGAGSIIGLNSAGVVPLDEGLDLEGNGVFQLLLDGVDDGVDDGGGGVVGVGCAVGGPVFTPGPLDDDGLGVLGDDLAGASVVDPGLGDEACAAFYDDGLGVLLGGGSGLVLGKGFIPAGNAGRGFRGTGPGPRPGSRPGGEGARG